jgi:hypothetical protein
MVRVRIRNGKGHKVSRVWWKESEKCGSETEPKDVRTYVRSPSDAALERPIFYRMDFADSSAQERTLPYENAFGTIRNVGKPFRGSRESKEKA